MNIQDVERINYLELNKLNHFTGISIQSYSQVTFSFTGSSNFTRNEDYEKNQRQRHIVQGESMFPNNIIKSPPKQNDQASKFDATRNSQVLMAKAENDKINRWKNEASANSAKNFSFEGNNFNEENIIKNSLEYSELAVSSYSISSGFFKDSFSDDIPSPKYDVFEDISPNTNNTNDEGYHMELYEQPKRNHKFSQVKKDKKKTDALKQANKSKSILTEDPINNFCIKARKESNEENIRRSVNKLESDIHPNGKLHHIYLEIKNKNRNNEG